MKKRCLVWAMLFGCLGMMAFAPKTKAANKVLSNPKQVATTFGIGTQSQWDLVQFGSWNGKPITWRVLHVSGNDVFLLSEKILMKHNYHSKQGPVTWKDSSIRSFLNGSFYSIAFSSEEKKYIKNTNVKNTDISYKGCKANPNTVDKIYLPSIAEVKNKSYGFKNSMGSDVGRFVFAANSTDTPGSWLLRTPGLGQTSVCVVNAMADGSVQYGKLEKDDDGKNVPDTGFVYANTFEIRPVMHINISKVGICKYVGYVKAKGRVTTVKAQNVMSSVKVAPKKATFSSAKNVRTRSIAMKFKKVSKATGYQVVYAKNKSFTKSKKTKSTTKRSLTLKKLSKGTYYVKVRAYRTYNKTKVYGSYSTVKKIKVKK